MINVLLLLQYSGIDKRNVHEVVLVGGPTHIPKVQTMIQAMETESAAHDKAKETAKEVRQQHRGPKPPDKKN